MSRASRKSKSQEAPRNRLEVDERRAQLLALGIKLFSENPYDELKVEVVAEKAGISKGLLYHYFPTKRAFYVAVLRAGAQELLQVTDGFEDLAPLERAQKSLDRYLSYVAEHRAPYVALLRGGVGSDPEVAKVIEETRSAFLARIVEGFSAEPLPPLWRLMLRGWIGFVEAASIEWAANPEISQEQVRDLLLSNLLSVVSALLPDSTKG